MGMIRFKKKYTEKELKAEADNIQKYPKYLPKAPLSLILPFLKIDRELNKFRDCKFCGKEFTLGIDSSRNCYCSTLCAYKAKVIQGKTRINKYYSPNQYKKAKRILKQERKKK